MPAAELSPIHFDFEPPKEIQSECGLGAIILTKEGIAAGLDVRKIIYQMGMDYQHRAQGSVGVTISDGRRVESQKDLGWVSVALGQGAKVPRTTEGFWFLSKPTVPMLGEIHTRYPTSGGSNHRENIQPFNKDGIWFAHHGNLTNMDEVRARTKPESALSAFLRKIKREKLPDSDSWFAFNAILSEYGRDVSQKLVNAQGYFEGGWAFILTDGKAIVASRDPYGIRPLMLGYLGPEESPWGYVVGVETSAFERIKGYRSYREIEPGETVRIDQNGELPLNKSPKGRKACAFEGVYLQSVSSEYEGKSVYDSRRDAGRIMWREAPIGLEDNNEIIVVPVPDSGRPSAYGYVEEGQKVIGSRIRIEEAMVKNRYVGRSYIEPSNRRVNVEDMYSIIEELVRDRIVVLVDDSIVKGITSRAIVSLFRRAGAKEVHLRIVSPPIVWASQYGVDQSGILFAKEYPNKADREAFLGVNSLSHLSLDGLAEALGKSQEDLCMRCMGGDGPPLPRSMIALNEA